MKLVMNNEVLNLDDLNTFNRKVIYCNSPNIRLTDCMNIRYCTYLCYKGGHYCSRRMTLFEITILVHMQIGIDYYCCTKFRSDII